MAIKHRIVFKKVDRDRGTNSATGDSLDLSDDGISKPEQRISASDGESARRGVSSDDMEYQSGGAYSALIKLFREHVKNENNT